jgi:hypothetical protein
MGRLKLYYKPCIVEVSTPLGGNAVATQYCMAHAIIERMHYSTGDKDVVLGYLPVSGKHFRKDLLTDLHPHLSVEVISSIDLLTLIPARTGN